MKHIILLVSFAIFLFSCRKLKDKIQEDLIVKAITDGVWRVTNYTKGGTNLTADFASYRFQFYMNSTVDAINNGTIDKKGTWQADVNARTVTANFTNTTLPLLLLNGTWKITRNNWTFVEATQTVNGEVANLRIDK